MPCSRSLPCCLRPPGAAACPMACSIRGTCVACSVASFGLSLRSRLPCCTPAPQVLYPPQDDGSQPEAKPYRCVVWVGGLPQYCNCKWRRLYAATRGCSPVLVGRTVVRTFLMPRPRCATTTLPTLPLAAPWTPRSAPSPRSRTSTASLSGAPRPSSPSSSRWWPWPRWPHSCWWRCSWGPTSRCVWGVPPGIRGVPLGISCLPVARGGWPRLGPSRQGRGCCATRCTRVSCSGPVCDDPGCLPSDGPWCTRPQAATPFAPDRPTTCRPSQPFNLPQGFPSGASFLPAAAFHAGLAAICALYLLFWLQLNLMQASRRPVPLLPLPLLPLLLPVFSLTGVAGTALHPHPSHMPLVSLMPCGSWSLEAHPAQLPIPCAALLCRLCPSWLLSAPPPPCLGASRCRALRQGRPPSPLRSRSEGVQGHAARVHSPPCFFSHCHVLLTRRTVVSTPKRSSARVCLCYKPSQRRTGGCLHTRGPLSKGGRDGEQRDTGRSSLHGVGVMGWEGEGGAGSSRHSSGKYSASAVHGGRGAGFGCVCLAVSVSSAMGGVERAGARAQPAGAPRCKQLMKRTTRGRWRGGGRKVSVGSRRAPQPYRGLGD